MTAIILQFPNRRQHRYFKCPGTHARCVEARCIYCNGGLSFCTVCGQGEGELEEFCPGPKEGCPYRRL